MHKPQPTTSRSIVLKKHTSNQPQKVLQANKMPSKSVQFNPKNENYIQTTLDKQTVNLKSPTTKNTNLIAYPPLDKSISQKKINKSKLYQSQSKTARCNSIHFGREEKLILYLSPQLEKFSAKHKLREKKPQIQYVNTLKKLKKTGIALGCQVRAKSQGIQLQLSNDLQRKVEDQLRFTVRKQFDRFERKRLVKQSNNCYQQAVNFNSTLQQHKKEMNDCLKINEKERQYKSFDVSRFQSYLKGKATKSSKYAYYIKKQIEEKLKKVEQEQKLGEEDLSEKSESLWDTKKNTFYSNSILNRKFSAEEAQSLNSSPKQTTTSRLSDYKEDLIEFLEICQFYKKIQHELLRYLPNNHIANKINTVVSQVQYGSVIKTIYDKCDTDITQLTPHRIVNILKKNHGILSTMNYIVNIIKLNISAERRKRFVDVQKTINKFEGIISQRKEFVCEKLKKINNPELKKDIKESLLKTKVDCAGMNPSYTQFVKQGEQQQFSQLNTFKNRRTICQILKFESLMR